jgi:sugar O-acyltransferase (sialic acid O-acetyltransferase NeuD family)
MSSEAVVFGASGHGKVIADILEKCNVTIHGFVDDDPTKWGQEFFGYPIHGGIEYLDTVDKAKFEVFVAIGDNETRRKIAGELRARSARFGKAVHPSAQIGKNVIVGNGTVVMANAVINADAVVGEHCIVNTASSVGHDNRVADFVHVSSGVRLGGNVTVGELSWIGLGSVVINNVTIGANTIIGAGSVVIRDAEQSGIYIGNPARLLKTTSLSFQRIAIYGAGGFGREVAWFFDDLNAQSKRYEVACFIDDDKSIQGAVLNGIPVHNLEDASRLFPGATVVGGIGAPRVRQTLMENAASKGFVFETFIHPNVETSQWNHIGRGTLLCAGNILTTNITIGEHVQINLECTIGHDVIMGDYTTLAPGVHVSGFVCFGKRVYVGTGAVIINGTQENPIVIGDDAVIGAGACVIRSVPPGLTVGGVPARPLHHITGKTA